MKVFRRYGKWHRVHKVDSILQDPQMATTLCGIRIPAKKAECHMAPLNHMVCQHCYYISRAAEITKESLYSRIPTIEQKLKTRKGIISEIRDLIKPTFFIVHIHGVYGVEIEVAWKSDATISVENCSMCYLTKAKLRKCVSLNSVHSTIEEMGRRVLNVCDASDALAKKSGRGSQEFFEELLDKAEHR